MDLSITCQGDSCQIMFYFALLRLKDAWSFASALDLSDSWNELAEGALVHAELSIGKNSSIIVRPSIVFIKLVVSPLLHKNIEMN